jgi:hypothetical protein
MRPFSTKHVILVVCLQFGSVVAVLVGNSRKTMTIILSFILFPKPFATNYITGGALVRHIGQDHRKKQKKRTCDHRP